MNEEMAKRLAVAMALLCVRNTSIEDIDAGIEPHSPSGDYSDVKVVTPIGEIAWPKASRIRNDEMRAFMKQVVDRLYTILFRIDRYARRVTRAWDAPKSARIRSAADECDALRLSSVEGSPMWFRCVRRFESAPSSESAPKPIQVRFRFVMLGTGGEFIFQRVMAGPASKARSHEHTHSDSLGFAQIHFRRCGRPLEGRLIVLLCRIGV
jgi:hypothetical protein